MPTTGCKIFLSSYDRLKILIMRNWPDHEFGCRLDAPGFGTSSSEEVRLEIDALLADIRASLSRLTELL